MLRNFLKRYLLFIGSWLLCLSPLSYADASSQEWASWFNQQLDIHPDVIAAKEAMNAAVANAEGRDRPLYNPQLETEYQQFDDFNNYDIGLNQTIDLWDKRGARQQQGRFSRMVAEQNFRAVRQKKAAQILQAIVQWQAARQRADLAVEQEQQLKALLDLIKGRQQVGDLGTIDAELTYLSLSQRLYDTARAMAALRQAEAGLQVMLPGLAAERMLVPEQLWSTIEGMFAESMNDGELLDKHPLVMASRFRWEVLREQAELAQRQTKADPTIGISAGKEEDEDYIGFRFSIPLNIRNNFSAFARSASQTALSAEAVYLSSRRTQQFAMAAARDSLIEYEQRYQYWQSIMSGRGERSGNLLKKQWRSGDLSTTAYLLMLQQRTEGLLAGIDLQSRFQLVRIDWLLQAGLVDTALQQASRQPIQDL